MPCYLCRFNIRLAMAFAMPCTIWTSTIMMITAVQVTVWSNFLITVQSVWRPAMSYAWD